MTSKLIHIATLIATCACFAQDNTLHYFLNTAEENNPLLLEYENLKIIGEYDNQLITAEESSFKVDVTSEIMAAPYFNNDGAFLAVTSTPSADAYGYAEPVSNGALYSAQLNIYKAIFNRSRVADLLFQNRIRNEAIHLSATEVRHQLYKTITTRYILAYLLQRKINLTEALVSDLDKRLQVVTILVKNGVLQQSDYLLLQLDIEKKQLELDQLKNNLNDAALNLNNASGLPAMPLEPLEIPDIDMAPLAVTFQEVSPPSSLLGTSGNASSSAGPETMAPGSSIPKDTISVDSLPYHYQRKFENERLQLLAEQQVMENSYKPQLSLYGNTGLNAVDLDRIYHYIGFSAGLKLSVPIYDGGQKRIRELQKDVQYRNLEVQKDNQDMVLHNTLQSLLDQIESIESSLQLVESQLQKQEHVLELFKGKMVQGQVSIIDYLKVVADYKLLLDSQLQMQANRWLLQTEYNAINW